MNFQQDDDTNQTFGRPSGMNNLRRRSNRNNGSLVDKIKDSFAPRKGSLKNWAKETAAYGFALYCATIPHQFIRVPQETEFPSNTSSAIMGISYLGEIVSDLVTYKTEGNGKLAEDISKTLAIGIKVAQFSALVYTSAATVWNFPPTGAPLRSLIGSSDPGLVQTLDDTLGKPFDYMPHQSGSLALASYIAFKQD